MVYERWRELLRDELGIAPSLAMSALHVWALEQAAPEQAAACQAAEQGPETRYARRPNGVSIAYQVLGEGPVDVVNVPGFMSRLDMQWANPGADQIRRAIVAALANPKLKAGAQRIARALGRRDGATAATEMIERVGQPATPNGTRQVRPQAPSRMSRGRS